LKKIEKNWKGALDFELQEANVVKRRKSKQGYEEDMGEEAQEQDCPGWLRSHGLQEEKTVHRPSKEVPAELTLSISLSLSLSVPACVRACVRVPVSFFLCLALLFYFSGFLSVSLFLFDTHTHTFTRSLSFTH